MLTSDESRRAAALALGALGLATATAFAAPAPSPAERAQEIQSLAACRKLPDPGERVACYDKAVDALDIAEKKGDVVVVSREHVEAARKQAFGFNLPSLDSLFKGAGKSEAVDKLTIDLERAHREPDGRWVFVSVDGAVWRQMDDQEYANDPHKGSKLLVTRGALGSYFCKVDGQPGVRCARVS